MSWSVTIGRIAGTEVRLHITFILFLAWIFGVNWAAGGAELGLVQPRLHGVAVRLRGGA